VVKLTRYIERMDDMFSLSPATFDLLKLVMEVCFISHMVACLWWGLSVQMTTSAWIDTAMVRTATLRESSLGNQYLMSVYWTFTTLITVGYGDIVPVNSSEQVSIMYVCVICMY